MPLELTVAGPVKAAPARAGAACDRILGCSGYSTTRPVASSLAGQERSPTAPCRRARRPVRSPSLSWFPRGETGQVFRLKPLAPSGERGWGEGAALPDMMNQWVPALPRPDSPSPRRLKSRSGEYLPNLGPWERAQRREPLGNQPQRVYRAERRREIGAHGRLTGKGKGSPTLC